MSEIDIQKYFHFMRDDYGTVYGIQEIGDVRELIKDIRQQNEQLKRLEQELKEKDNFLKWLITQQYYIIPKKLKQKIKEILKDV